MPSPHHDPRKESKDEALGKVSVLAGHGLTQAQIASQLGISQPTVNRLVRESVKRKWLRNSATCLLSPLRQKAIESLLFASNLPEQLAKFAGDKAPCTLRVFHSGNHSESLTEDQSYQLRRQSFAPLVADYLGSQVLSQKQLRVLGVAWGGTLLAAINALGGATEDNPREHGKLKILPICGDSPEVQRNTRISSSSLAGNLGEIINGDSESPYSFSGIPATIPHKFFKRDGAQAKTIKEYLKSTSKGYRTVFSSSKRARALIEDTDMILTAVGQTNPDRAPWLEDACEFAGGNLEHIRQATAGNIGGLFIPKIGASVDDKEIVKQLNRGWTGVRLPHIKHCAEKARAKGLPGVTAVVVGEKVDIVMACVAQGLINTLLVDHVFAGRLSKKLDELLKG